ncbi:MAG: hypothetical protein LQ346_000290 [Caloplaca aetnensis]|nr:MAG: hypothetical protein LQ346_000290 [Caloplaca aetnensis]
MPHRVFDENAQSAMGIASSQVASQPSASSDSHERKSRRDKNGKGLRSRDIEANFREDEDADALVLRRGSHPPTPEPLQEYDAPSAQLIAESSSALDFRIAATPEEPDVSMNENMMPEWSRRERKRKRRSSALELSFDAGNLQPGSQRVGLEASPKLGREIGFDTTSENGLDLTQHTFSLDDIDENEEGLASLFQEYEVEANQPKSPVAGPPDYYDPAFSPIDQGFVESALANDSTGKKRKRKRKQRSDFNVFEIGAEHLDGTGQHAFDIDFDAFDEIFANEGTPSANPFNEELDHEFLNGILPLQESLSDRVHQEGILSSNTASNQRSQQPGKLPRVSPVQQPRKRRRTEVPNSLESQIPTHFSHCTSNEGQQDTVLRGLEDMQARSSSEVPYSHPGIHRRRPTPPPPLAKPSAPRGNKTQRGGKKGKDYDPPLQELSEKGGMFTDVEIEVLDAFRDRYCQENNESHLRFNELIQTNIRGHPEVTRLFLAIHDEIPYRTRQSVIRFCRRHFHNFSVRGSWTEADDDLLRDAIAKKGTAWTAVGEMISRFPEDCRDRYRNYLVNGEKRKTATWSLEEIRNLVRAVDFCMHMLRQQRVRAREERYRGLGMPSETESDQEIQDMKLINWQVVSDRMGSTRSRLQCSYKWAHLKNEDREKYRREIRRIEKGLSPRTEGSISGSWRLKRAVKKLKNMKTGDKYDFLQVFADCGAATEEDIRWTTLGSKEFRQRWSNMDFRAALEIFKSQVPGSDNMSYQQIVNRVLTRLMAEEPDRLHDRWNPDVDGDINIVGKRPSRREQSERKMWMAQNPTKSSKAKSKEFIDSEDDEEEEEAYEDRSRHRESETDKDDNDRDGNDNDNDHDIDGDGDDTQSLLGVADSAEERPAGHASSEIGANDQKRDGKPQRRYSLARRVGYNADESASTSARLSSDPGRSANDPTHTPDVSYSTADEGSGDESDDSLFDEDGSVDGELVDHLQELRKG